MADQGKYTDYTLREQCDILFGQLKNDRQSFESHWMDIANYIVPRRPKWMTSEENQGGRLSDDIIDSTATFALRTLSSGMMSGLTSPARPWFDLQAEGFTPNEDSDVDMWLWIVTRLMRDAYQKSNLYNTLPILYSDIGAFATSAMSVLEDFDNVIHCDTYPIGSYYIGNEPNGRIGVFGREFPWTAREIIDEFARRPDNSIDWSKVSTAVETSFRSDQTEQRFDIRHVVKPNDDYEPGNPVTTKRKYIAVYYELSAKEEEDKLLRKQGYDLFPILCPRWELSGEDVYGTNCPGMVALGDIKQLQFGEREYLKGIEKLVSPPMMAPLAMRNRGGEISLLPGAENFVPESSDRYGMRPVHEVPPQLLELREKQQHVVERIRRAFYEDLFLMLATRAGEQPLTATEVNERHEEKLLALGPVLEQLNQDLLDPLTDLTFEYLLRQGKIPPPPPQLEGANLKVEYISIMSRAQKSIGLGSVERFTQFVANVAAVQPEALDKVDVDKIISTYGDLVSVPPGILRDQEDVDIMRQQRAEQLQQQQQMEALKAGTESAKNLSQAETSGDNLLATLTGGGA
jgi:hypothetical protein